MLLWPPPTGFTMIKCLLIKPPESEEESAIEEEPGLRTVLYTDINPGSLFVQIEICFQLDLGFWAGPTSTGKYSDITLYIFEQLQSKQAT